ncbi:MAG: DUF2793 domain-containing protein [Hyphomonas sp.]
MTVNEALRALDQMVQLAVRSQTTGVQPSSSAVENAYVLPTGASGVEWVALPVDHVVSYLDEAWVAYPPVQGMWVNVKDEGVLTVFDGAGRAPLSVAPETPPLLGVNTTQGTTNRLSVKSGAVLSSMMT